MTDCHLCGEPVEEGVFEDIPLHRSCYDAESERSMTEDVIPGKPYLRSRPPKYMIPKEKWKEFDYEEE